jgi:hypothetical protein
VWPHEQSRLTCGRRSTSSRGPEADPRSTSRSPAPPASGPAAAAELRPAERAAATAWARGRWCQSSSSSSCKKQKLWHQILLRVQVCGPC